MKKITMTILLMAIITGFVQLSAQTETNKQYTFLLVRADGSGFPVKTGQINNIRRSDLEKVVKIKCQDVAYQNITFVIERREGISTHMVSKNGKITADMAAYFKGLPKFGLVYFIKIKGWNNPNKIQDFENITLKVL